jgi:Ala-tRNA(Pro) deacylase
MSIAPTVHQALKLKDIDHEILQHPPAPSSSRVAQAAHVAGRCMAKAVVLKDDQGFVLAVLPATHQILTDVLNSTLRRRLALAKEADLGRLFNDCERGAVPPLGPDYGIPTVVDSALRDESDIYLEAGDHEALVHVSEKNFELLMDGAQFLRFSRPCN